MSKIKKFDQFINESVTVDEISTLAADKADKWLPEDEGESDEFFRMDHGDQFNYIDNEVDDFFSKYYPEEQDFISNNRTAIINAILKKLGE
jgi:hypothetical protein